MGSSADFTSAETASVGPEETNTTVGNPSPDPSIAARQVAEGAEASPALGLPVEDFADCFPGSVSDTLCAVNGAAGVAYPRQHDLRAEQGLRSCFSNHEHATNRTMSCLESNRRSAFRWSRHSPRLRLRPSRAR